MPKTVPLAQTLQDLRSCMRKWGIDMYEAIPDRQPPRTGRHGSPLLPGGDLAGGALRDSP